MTQPDTPNQSLQQTLSKLGEREKELSAANKITRLLFDDKLSMSQTLEQVVKLLPQAMRYSAHASAMIEYQGRQLYSEDFRADTEHQSIKSDLVINDAKVGQITIAYGAQAPGQDPDAFLAEERQLLDHIAEVVSLFLEKSTTLEQLDATSRRVAQYEQIINHGPAIAFLWELSEGWPVLYVSENVATLGYSSDEFLTGKLMYDTIIHPDDLERVSMEIDRNLGNGKTRFEQRYRVITRSGETRLVRDWTVVNPAADGAARTVEGIIVDITEAATRDERTRKYLNLTDNLFIVSDTEGRVLDVNDKTCKMIETPREDLLGSEWLHRFIAADDLAAVLEQLKSNISEQRKGVQEIEASIVSASGRRYTIQWFFTVEWSAQGTADTIIAFGNDVSKQRRAEHREQSLAQFPLQNPNPVLWVNNERDVLLANQPAQDLLNAIAEGGKTLTPVWRKFLDRALATKNRDTQELTLGDTGYLFAIAPVDNESVYLYGMDVTEAKAINTRLKSVADNLPGALWEYTLLADGTDRIEFINEGCEKLWEVSAEELQGDPSQLWALVNSEDLSGMRQSVLDSARSGNNWSYEFRISPTTGKTKWLRSAGSPTLRTDGNTVWTTVAMDITEAKHSEQAISQALRKTIFVLAATVEARDPYTAGHEERVANIAKLIGEHMMLDAHRLTGLELASVVHDVGKINVPSEILSKPGNLSEAEFALIKMHPVVGAELLADIEFDWPISAIIRQHHERLDGSGYPDGLAGDEILLEARILAVADTLEAMASHRPYRAGLGIDRAAEEIREGAGTRYDPVVAAACLQLIEQGKIQLDNPYATV